MTTALRLGSWDELGEQAYRLRHSVFVEEQGVPVELEHDEHDATALHVLLLDDEGMALATGRLLSDGHIGRVAVLAQQRGQGHGRRVMRALIEEAARRGHAFVILHAQTDAQAFYASLGFEPVGEVFMEAGIPHVGMRLKLG
ncbi:MAG: family N-acetyltransferase [Rhodocyclales bacterium]|nr:family N-acetyltransferase [Rhodocyclales bacterium]